VPYVPDPENTILLETSLALFIKFKQLPQAMRLAMQLNDMEQIKKIFTDCSDP
jgi:26S proteasome regulatory subunit N1